MKKTFTLLCCAASMAAYTQITINSSHLPNSGDVLYTQAATFLTNVDLEASGPNYTWNFGYDVLQPGTLDGGTSCDDLGSLSLLNQLFFNNPLAPNYNSDFGISATLLNNPLVSSFVTIEDAYQIYKNSGGVYAMTGIVATVNGVPLNAQYVDRDIIYDLPLTYPASGNSHSVLSLDVPTVAYYGTDQYRNYVCDGWGTINIYNQTFDVLRVKSTLTGFDSVSVSLTGAPLGFQFPKDITTYQWISTDFKVPVLEVTSTAGGFGGAQLTIKTADLGISAVLNEQPQLGVYPNPATSSLRIADATSNDQFEIYSAEGNLFCTGNANHGVIDVADLPCGVYIIQSKRVGSIQQARFVKL